MERREVFPPGWSADTGGEAVRTSDAFVGSVQLLHVPRSGRRICPHRLAVAEGHGQTAGSRYAALDRLLSRPYRGSTRDQNSDRFVYGRPREGDERCGGDDRYPQGNASERDMGACYRCLGSTRGAFKVKSLLQRLEEEAAQTLKMLRESVSSLAESAGRHSTVVDELKSMAEEKTREDGENDDAGKNTE
jgi:hypothetical protein